MANKMFRDCYLDDFVKENMKGILSFFSLLFMLIVLMLSFMFSDLVIALVLSMIMSAVLSVGSVYLVLRARACDQRAADAGRAEAGSISKVNGRLHLQRGQILAATMANIANYVVSIDQKRTLIQASVSARKNLIASAVCMLFIVIMFICAFIYDASGYQTPTMAERRIIEFVFTTVLFAAIVFALRAKAMFRRSRGAAEVFNPYECTRKFGLYLRSFKRDTILVKKIDRPSKALVPVRFSYGSRIDEAIARAFDSVLPIVAVGRIGEPPVNSVPHIYLHHACWQEGVAKLISAATLIIVIADETPGLLWELECISKTNAINKLLLILVNPEAKPFDRATYLDLAKLWANRRFALPQGGWCAFAAMKTPGAWWLLDEREYGASHSGLERALNSVAQTIAVNGTVSKTAY